MTRISMKDAYDNKDVIQQIKILKDDVSSTYDKADEALNIAGGMGTKADEASVKATDALNRVTTVEATVNEHTTAIEAVETESEQALTDANDAFDTIQMSQDAESATLKAIRGTGYVENVPFPIASPVQTGMMNAQTYAGLVNLGARVDKLEASKTVFYVSFASDAPSQSEIASVFSTASGRSPVAGDYVTDIARALTYGYNGTDWIKVATSTDIPVFTTSTPGLIKGNTADGTVAAETDGTGSVNGWDTVKTDITNLKESSESFQSSLNAVEGEVAGLNADLMGKNDKLVGVTVTLSSSGWSGKRITVSVSGMTADAIVFVAPTPTSFEVYSNAQIRATAQSEGTLTFMCDSIPSENVSVQVVIA